VASLYSGIAIDANLDPRAGNCRKLKTIPSSAQLPERRVAQAGLGQTRQQILE
jgi:hypothetical protein